MNTIQTSWAKDTPPHGTFDDYVIIASKDTNERILMRPEEFEFLTATLFENWKKGKSKYIQLLKEWNECLGFNDMNENPSILLDTNDTIEAIKLIDGVDTMMFATLTKNDLKLLLDFLIKNQKNRLTIWKE
ncbi:hypothetical protein [uncultured Dokdonia sp.]|uniref:hypothetical protein n=1 Tax=uncultured Dokdonia sp. TaxID=575653 RepID=UPI00260B2AD8|nr:hypothetical protein [uncultured Dokdonia sp.]